VQRPPYDYVKLQVKLKTLISSALLLRYQG